MCQTTFIRCRSRCLSGSCPPKDSIRYRSNFNSSPCLPDVEFETLQSWSAELGFKMSDLEHCLIECVRPVAAHSHAFWCP
eukprot:6359172-Amphidinium_carterae.2